MAKINLEGKKGVSANIDTSTGKVELSKWNKEVILNLNPHASVLISSSKDGEKYKLQYNKYSVRVYDTPNGIEYDFILDKIPELNVFTIPMDSTNLVFFYQPELTQEEIDAGCIRPENVVGSYAVYHSSKVNNEYGCGKAFHIFRPLVTDAKGDTIWGVLNYDGANLTVTVDEDWLAKAKYPVIIDPNFGYETAGGSHWFHNAAHCAGSLFTTTEDGTLNSITAYIFTNGAPTVGMACYKHSDSTKLIADNWTGSAVSPAAWKTMTMADTAITASTEYLLLYGNLNYNDIYYDAGSTNQGHYGSQDANWNWVWDTPITFTHQNYKYSIYATYTAAATDLDVVVTDEELSIDNGFEYDEVTYTATVLDEDNGKLPASFVVNLRLDGVPVVANQALNSSVYSQSTGLLTLVWYVPSGFGAETVDLQWAEQTI